MKILKSSLKKYIRWLLYSLGIIGALHRYRNKKTLTVVAFHRVLKKNDTRWHQVDETWSVTDKFYQQCLVFFAHHYNLISWHDLEARRLHNKPLPNNALLVTFDDGWADNYDTALKINQAHQIKPLLFVTTSAIGKRILSWQETLFSAWRLGLLLTEPAKEILLICSKKAKDIVTTDDIEGLIGHIQASNKNKIAQIRTLAEDLADILPGVNQMLSVSELQHLSNNGVALGTHGVLHEPLLNSDSAKQDLLLSKQQLSAFVHANILINSMSYPHGQEDDKLIKATAEVGYKYIFTGREHINKIFDAEYLVFGRQNIEQPRFINSSNNLDKPALAFYLFSQKIN